MGDDDLFAFAGLWEHWESEDGKVIESCTLLTADANKRVSPVHDRHPVILPAKAYAKWLDPELHDPEKLQPLLKPYPAKKMVVTAVSTLVNSPKNDDPECVKPLAS